MQNVNTKALQQSVDALGRQIRSLNDVNAQDMFSRIVDAFDEVHTVLADIVNAIDDANEEDGI